MNKELILELRNQAIENVSSKHIDRYGQIQRTWLSDNFDLEFARLLIEKYEKLYCKHCPRNDWTTFSEMKSNW